MSVDRNSPYEKWKRDRGKVQDAITPIEPPKHEENKLCPNCRRSQMEIYLQPPSKFIDNQGLDNMGHKPGHYYWKCKLLECNFRIEMPGQQQLVKQLLPQPKDDIRQPLFAIPVKRRRKRSDIEGTEEDYTDFANFLGYRPQSINIVKSQEGYSA